MIKEPDSPAEECLDRNSILFTVSSSQSAFRWMLLFQRPCQTWPNSQSNDTFVRTDASGGGAPNSIQPCSHSGHAAGRHLLNAAVFCSIIGMFRSDSCFVVSKTVRVLYSSMSEKTLLSEQTVLSVKQVPAIHFTSIPAASFPLHINDHRGKKELMHWWDCI